MDKCVWRGYSIYFMLCVLMLLTLAVSVSAVTISSVTVVEPDTFYSGVANNSVVHLLVNISNVNETAGNIVAVTANFIGLDADCGSGSIITLVPQPGGTVYAGSCDVSYEAGTMSYNTFKSAQIIIIANETYGPSAIDTSLILSLYNLNVGSLNNYQGIRNSAGNLFCYRFGSGSTNFNDVTNFNNLNDITLIIEAYGDSSCINDGLIQGYPWNTGWLPVASLKFNNVNFQNNAAHAQKLVNLSNIVKLRFASPKTYQNTRLSVDTAQLPELDVNTFSVKLYHLSLLNPVDSFIVSDNTVQASVITWTPNGLDSLLNDMTYDVEFTVSKGFKGFTITDNIVPKIVLNAPSNNAIFNTSTIVINTTVNGTGTGVSKVLFYINNVSNTAVCTPLSLNSESSNCVLLINESDGQYNLNVQAYDYGGVSGNVANLNTSFIVQTSAPTLVVAIPTPDATYTATSGSMLKLDFSASDGNGISSCWYSLDGPITANNVLVQNCTSDNVVQLYLSDGSYTLSVYSNDTLGLVTNQNISFIVKDTKAPVISNNTALSTKKNVTLSVITDESAACKYDTNDVLYDKMRDKFTDNILVHSDKIILAEQGKVYNYFVRCSDLSGNVNKESFQIAVYYGDIVNDTVKNETKPDPTESLDILLLPAGKNMMAFDKTYNPISTIALMTNYAVQDITLNIVMVSSPAATYSEKVYKYVSIEHTALKDSRIDAANITFRVDKTWITANKLNLSDIVLVRYTGDWTPLDTKFLREDGNDEYYIASSPGLSLFAISTKVPAKIVTAPVINTTISNATNTTAATKLLSKRNYNWFWVILIAVIVFVIIMLIVLVQRNERNSPPPIFPGDRTVMGKLRRLFR